MKFSRFAWAVLASAAAALGFARDAAAHPHVWVTMTSEVLYENGQFVGVKHRWTFDDMFSAYATQGLDKNNDGKLSREELADLAEVNITSMKDFDYFTKVKIGGKAAAFADPKDYWLEHANDRLTLTFTLPVSKPVPAQSVDLDVYDPTYFVAFEYDQKDPLKLTGAAAACKLTLARPGEASSAQRPESFFNNPDAAENYGAAYANKIAVKCP